MIDPRTTEHLYRADAAILTELIETTKPRLSRPQLLGKLIRAEKAKQRRTKANEE